jgi:hypothetical protein
MGREMTVMSESSVPKPLSAYVGLIVASLEDARGTGRSPIAQVARLPLAAAGQLLTARHRYDALAEQGDAVIDVVVGMVRQRFVSADVPSAETDFVDHLAADDVAADDLDAEDTDAEDIDELVDEMDAELDAELDVVIDLEPASESYDTTESDSAFATDDARRGSLNGLTETAETTLDDYPERLDDTAPDELAAEADVLTSEDVEAAVQAATAEPAEPAKSTSESPLEQLESFQVKPEVGAEAGGLKSAADLPLADFDHMTTAQLRGRLRTLDAVGLVQLLDYERAHANRVGIIVMLENRLAKLHAAQNPQA